MGHVNAAFAIDLLQLLNIALQERRDIFEKAELDGCFIHSPKPDTFEVRSLAGPIAVFSMTGLPGCCGVCVSYHSDVLAPLQKKLGTALLAIRMDAARRKGYGQMIATVLADNQAEIKILTQAGWVRSGEFRNPQTQHLVTLWITNL